MKGLENNTYLAMLLISNIVALILLLTALKKPGLSRLLFSLLFTWAGWINWHTALNTPGDYLDYADLSIFSFYRTFIHGWFKEHLFLIVGFIATCQFLIAIGMQSKGVVFKMAAIGAIIFLLAIAPLGVGSGFPCTIIMATAMYLLLRHAPTNYLWIREKGRMLQ
jgi:hypothetical protein